MKWPFSSSNETNYPGLVGKTRIDTSAARVLRRVKPGDIVIINEPDLTQAAAEELIAAGVVGVVNVAPAITDRYPTYGALVLLQAGVVVLDEAPISLFNDLKDGKKISIEGDSIWRRGKQLAEARALTLPEVSKQIEDARQRVNEQLSAFAGNTAEFLSTESPLLLEGMGVPDIECDMAERHVVVVAGGENSEAELAAIKWFIKSKKPVLVGVSEGIETLVDAGYKPDLLVGDPRNISDDVLLSGSEIVLPAAPDGHTEGVERVEDLGVSAVTFPAVAGPEELALLLADYGGAAVIVAVGMDMTLRQFLDPEHISTAAPSFLTRLKISDRIVSATALTTLRPERGVSWWSVLLLILASAFTGIIIYLYGFPDAPYAADMIDGWNQFATTIQGWFQ